MKVRYFVMRFGREHQKVAEFLTEKEAEKYITEEYPKDLMGDITYFIMKVWTTAKGKV